MLPPAKAIGLPVCAAATAAAGRQRPVMPVPVGTSRSQGASCGRSFTALLAIVAVAGLSPGEFASTLRLPAVLPDCTIAMHSPANAFRFGPESGSWLVGSPLHVPIASPGPVTLNVTSLSVIGR